MLKLCYCHCSQSDHADHVEALQAFAQQLSEDSQLDEDAIKNKYILHNASLREGATFNQVFQSYSPRIQTNMNALQQCPRCNASVFSRLHSIGPNRKRVAVEYTQLTRTVPPLNSYEYCCSYPLSRGSFDRPEVYLGESHLHQRVVIKSNNICNIALEGDAESTIREIELLRHLAGLEHPSSHFVTCLDSFRCNQRLYLIMPHVAGVTLFDVLTPQRQLIDFHPHRVHIFKQLIEALDYLHTHGIAHFDIKCENVMYDEKTAHLTLIDFGGARRLPEDGTVPWHCFGTPATQAPEICFGHQDVAIAGKPVDMWSAGIIFFILNTRRGLVIVYDKEKSKFACRGVLPFFSGPPTVARSLATNHMLLDDSLLCANMLDQEAATRLTAAQVMNSSWWFNHQPSGVAS